MFNNIIRISNWYLFLNRFKSFDKSSGFENQVYFADCLKIKADYLKIKKERGIIMDPVLEGLLEAIDDEIAAQKKYQYLKEQTDDEQAKALFEQLIKDEIGHEKLLRSRYEALKDHLKDK
ncbi:rubrerythrin [Halanaerobium saccharolyticum]|uniref:Rubrerythrin n=1 Tax=Halanaerobium saccharolyticum TaxID=43595 RepID=A0A4R7Z4Z2_9FIRM|nr:ferritin family protein [Halanaerobium saccharolyticum]RAK08133.1 rubrerythrin [Halanaerobium saccharolyticum]TDW04340.1 rubrerythrin [Halanaerobium saccharolyticum]TDX59631.1 rubrerythrin [Halanaerobium saccharolyticum]